MVTAAEMSGILGATVAVEGEDGGGSTTCRYKPGDRSTPNVELTVDWGGGRAAMAGVGILGTREPGIAGPLAGLGDEAASIGPALWVRVGEDLVNLTVWGVDEDVAVAKRIIDVMRPRMGASAQAKTSNDAASDDAAKVGRLVSGLLNRLSEANERPRPSDARDDTGATAPRVEEPTFRSAAGLPRRKIPLVKGLTMVLARHEPRRGDWEGIGAIDDVSPAEISMTYRADPPDIGPLVIARVVRRADLKESHRLYGRFTPGDPVEFPGSPR
jgi:hypothetical protein